MAGADAGEGVRPSLLGGEVSALGVFCLEQVILARSGDPRKAEEL